MVRFFLPVADDLAHDRHRMIVGAEPSDRDGLTVLDQRDCVFNGFNDFFSLLAHRNPSFLKVTLQDFKIVQQ